MTDSVQLEIDFYHLKSADFATPLALLSHKAVASGHKMLILARPEHHEAISSALWVSRPESFLAHNIDDEAGAAHAPVWISSRPDANQINADFAALTSGMAPSELTSFSRIFNLFDGSDAHALTIARQSWKDWLALDGVRCRYFAQEDNGHWAQRK